jgi:hypothetical protein
VRGKPAGGDLAVVPFQLSRRCARELCDFASDPPPVASADVRGRHVAENIVSCRRRHEVINADQDGMPTNL